MLRGSTHSHTQHARSDEWTNDAPLPGPAPGISAVPSVNDDDGMTICRHFLSLDQNHAPRLGSRDYGTTQEGRAGAMYKIKTSSALHPPHTPRECQATEPKCVFVDVHGG